jgi:stearoyl-CoA desaturase (delta-9 desaturase)
MTLKNWPQHINWLNTYFIIIVPAIGLISTYWVGLQYKTAIFSIAYYFFSGLGIVSRRLPRILQGMCTDKRVQTAGYHRLWAHTSYKATVPLKIVLAAGGAAAVEGSARWWSREHRAHHRYTDTDKDPYSVRKGLLYSQYVSRDLCLSQHRH